MKALQISTVLLMIFFAVGSLSAQYTSNYDENVDFSQFKTYAFAGWSPESDKRVNEMDKVRVENAFKAELDARGMTYVEKDADAVFTLFVVVNTKTSTNAYTTYTGGYGFYGGWGWGYGGMGMGIGGSYTTYSESSYNEGTLVVDMYNDADKKMVWQGVIQTVVKDNPKKRQKTIPMKVKKLMKKYPVKPVKKKKK